MADTFSVTLHVWRQTGPSAPGHLERILMDEVSPDQSFLEMLDDMNLKLMGEGKVPIVFDHDCREGICGCCGAVVNGLAHGGQDGTTLCQLHMRSFSDGDHIYVEPWRSRAFPILKDLVVDRDALDKMQQAGGYVSVNTGAAPPANTIPVAKGAAEESFDNAACIGCGACVAACPNASAALFVGARLSQFALLPQGKPEALRRALAMVSVMDAHGFGGCTNIGECSKACPKEISLTAIARLNREYLKAVIVDS